MCRFWAFNCSLNILPSQLHKSQIIIDTNIVQIGSLNLSDRYEQILNHQELI